MINIGLVDLLLLAILFAAFFYALRSRNVLPFSIILIVVFLIEIERLAPGSMAYLGDAIRAIDGVNAQGPHIQVLPIVTINP